MPTVIRMPKEQVHQRRNNRNGFNIGCFRVCTCMHLSFVTSKSGMLKIFELLLGSCCETLLINFGQRELSATAFNSFLTTVTACLSTTFILCLCYTLSSRSYSLIRQSLFVRLIIKTCCGRNESVVCVLLAGVAVQRDGLFLLFECGLLHGLHV